jgi:hypothetical protein
MPESPWAFGDISPQVMECAIAEAVASAVAGRSEPIEGHVVPAQLTDHLTEAVLGVVRKHELSCPATEIEWQAGAFRYADVADALRTYTGPFDSPHPSTDEWTERGVKLWGSTIEDQIVSYLKVHSVTVSPRLLLGHGALLRAAAALSTASEPYAQLITATRGLTVPGRWHRYVFRMLEEMGE